MESDDEILSRIMEKTVAEPVTDDGFTAEAVRRLRGHRKRAPFPRRALFVTSLAATGCLTALVPMWDAVAAFARLLEEGTAPAGLTNANGGGTVLAAALVVTAALSSVVFLIDRVEASR